MSTHKAPFKRRVSVPQIRAMKGGDRPIVCLTAYTSLTARWLDSHVDLLLVGDSLGMVIYGMENTLSVTLEMMIAHATAVRRGSERACLVCDMPFGTYEESPAVAFRNAARIMSESGASAVKIEGGREMADTIRYLVARGIPVMGHIGLMPQSVHASGGFAAQGRSAAEAERIKDDARAVAEAGAFSMVVEGTVEPLAREITAAVDVPTIGIGASAACDGQILVTEDLVGLFMDFTPKFVKRYALLGEQIEEAGRRFAEDVRARRFPAEEHTFALKTRPETGAATVSADDD